VVEKAELMVFQNPKGRRLETKNRFQVRKIKNIKSNTKQLADSIK